MRTVAAPIAISMKRVTNIRRQAPRITLAVVASNSLSDLRRREADIAIRHVRPTEPELIGRLVCEMTGHFYAADAWLAGNGVPRSVADLCNADLVGFEPVERFAAHLNAVGVPVSADRIRIVSESAVVVWEMIRRGHGVGVTLREIAERTPGVTRIVPELPGIPAPVWLVSHRELRTNRRVRLFFEELAGELRRCSAAAGAALVRRDDRRP